MSKSNHPTQCRNLSKADLGGVIFGCKNDTKEECLSKQLFGLPSGHFTYVRNIQPGLPLFLFNYSERKLYGVFEAASCGQMHIDPYAWTKDASRRTMFPAQVQILVRHACQPLSEDQFSSVIRGNYYHRHRFWFELDHFQASRLISWFTSQPDATIPRIQQKAKQMYVPKTLEVREAIEPPKLESSSENLNSNENSGGPDSSVCQEGDYQTSESSLRTENDDKENVYQKLRKLTSESSLRSENDDKENVCQQLQKLDLKSDSSHDTQKGETTNKNEIITADDGNKIEETAKDEDVIDQLMKEVNELKEFKKQQTLKTIHMEDKLKDLEAENQCLRMQCEGLQSSDQSEFLSASEEIDSFSDRYYDWDVIFIAGGYDGKMYLSSANTYSLSKDRVKSLQPMPSVSAFASVAKLNDRYYVVGGGDGTEWFNRVMSYNLHKDEWRTEVSTLKEKNGSLATATVDGKIFAMGGGNGNVSFSEMQMLEPDIGGWIPARSMRQKRFALGAVTLNNAIYAVGGYDGDKYLSSVERFDPRDHSWSNVESMNSRRGCHSLVVLNEKIYAMGGFDGANLVSSVEVFDPRLGKWMPEASMNHARGYASAVTIVDTAYIIGGVMDDQTLPESIERYEEGKGWEVMNLKSIGKRCYASAITI